MTNATRKAISQTCLALILAAFHPQPSTALEQPATTAQPQKDTTDGFDYSFDRLSFEVTKSLGDRPAFVIWLLDESGSVHERRTRVLERLDQIYGSNQRPHSLYSAIAGFGDKTHFLTPDPVSELASLKAAADQLKQDDSGVERVFTAVVDCVERWKDFIKEHKELDVSIVLATDEIGDDPEQLEDAVKECRNHGIRIFCLGNAAPFGQSKGYVRYVYEDGFRSEIPVDQGPETAIADVLNLPIWPPHSPEQFRQISSGFGPWALSRLCNATDGTFFIVEDTGKPTFPRATLADYTPDYAPLAEQQKAVSDSPLRKALASVAKEINTPTDNRGLSPPAFRFRADSPSSLRSELAVCQKSVAIHFFRVENAQRALEPSIKEHTALTEKRWQAAFDLAYGRLLFQKARLTELVYVLARMKMEPADFSMDRSNTWLLLADDSAKPSLQTKNLVAEGTAYLRRVIAQHPNTPFAYVAEAELKRGVGWKWEESHRVYNEPPERFVHTLLIQPKELQRRPINRPRPGF